MNRYLSESSSRILLGEGTDDERVIYQICERSVPERSFSISVTGGVSQLFRSMELLVMDQEMEVVGVIVDRDRDLSSRWDAVRNRLVDEGFNPPPQPEPDGTIITETEDLPRVGVWLMPDNQSTGELEDFVARMIPDNDPVWPLSDNYIEGIPLSDRKFTETKTQRVKVHAWLAAREDPRQMGQAIRAMDLDVNGELCEKFVAWLRRLFG